MTERTDRPLGSAGDSARQPHVDARRTDGEVRRCAVRSDRLGSMTSTSPVDAATDPMVVVAQQLADEVLFPDAQRVDRGELVPQNRFTALAEAGLFGIAGPADHGFADIGPSATRHVMSAIGSGCGATFFCWAQHHGVVRTMRGSTNTQLRDEWLDPLSSGERIAGVAFAHLRRTGRAAITATPVDGGWILDGTAPWATSWGIADAFAIAAESPDGRIVWSLIPGSADQRGMRAVPLALPVFSSTGTVVLEFDSCFVADASVVAIDDLEAWRRTDRLRAALGQPAVLGVADRAIRLLFDAAHGDGDPAAAAAARLRTELEARWATDAELLARLLDPEPTSVVDDEVAVMSRHRAACLDVAQRSCTALLAAVGGRGMDLDHPAQRLAREASFYVIQAQTADGRSAVLDDVSIPTAD